MQIGLHVMNFTWEGGPRSLASHLAAIVRAADEAGFGQITVMDHLFQIGAAENYHLEMLEGYTALGFIAAHTSKARIGTLVTGVTYRYPGMLIKQATTLNVLSGGRGFLGIGAAWNEREHRAFGVPFPSLKERFARLEETLQLAHQVWSGNSAPFRGTYYQLEEPLLSPPAITRPRPRILVGGGGERKTLKLVAQYADACNLLSGGDPEVARHKLAVLQEHCESLGRDYTEIEKTINLRLHVAQDGSNVNEIVEEVATMGDLGFDMVTLTLPEPFNLKAINLFGTQVIPQVASLGRPAAVAA